MVIHKAARIWDCTQPECEFHNLSCSHICVNKRGYNKFLDISKDITVSINEDKIEEDMLWDGLKGYITNTD